jgi:hypothetical protein
MIDCTVVIATYDRREFLDAMLTEVDALPERPPAVAARLPA